MMIPDEERDVLKIEALVQNDDPCTERVCFV